MQECHSLHIYLETRTRKQQMLQIVPANHLELGSSPSLSASLMLGNTTTLHEESPRNL